MNLESAVLAYLSLLPPEARKEQQLHLNRFVRWMGRERALQDLNAPDVGAFAERSVDAGISDVARALQPVKEFLADAKKQGLTATNLAVHIKAPRTSPKRASSHSRPARQTIALTPEGYHKLQEELESLKAQRPHMAETIRLARADGDLKENAPYHAAREQQGQVEARIRELEATFGAATVLDASKSDSLKADLGTTVVLVEEESGKEFRYLLVVPNEARPAEGKLSIASPLGKSLVDRHPGELIEVTAPAGIARYQLARVER